jgi:hypothetical protein
LLVKKHRYSHHRRSDAGGSADQSGWSYTVYTQSSCGSLGQKRPYTYRHDRATHFVPRQHLGHRSGNLLHLLGGDVLCYDSNFCLAY